MALTKQEVLDLFVRHVDRDVIAQRMKQMYQVLDAPQQTAAYNLIKGDLLAVLTETKSDLQDRDANIDAAITQTDSTIADINNA
jgi:hypothetical protein